ncbi:sn-glycerol-3-phosphate ABC transporter ATP-binding protein UgpC [Pseudoduganella sp. FT25W]|jgi:multiple sugar transport system ATP-binding protein|uniref:sn-glycerol-3-phosphate ABC transporter ATP-binding protein UgpC n=1 Tax=Duganella alba TaxID=2666081 RepID=A0A6L5QDD8_9BURK|nr:sn-glycerol-3-phosphate ABC transporter ATP-binding protein UgpC [Duganella alba]MRX07630.1 sn-glycerol-3-phosphate ABC transporter ATP-binding protein UgpC [Duganella alba]MRX16014.1 sn-glycerol-3-phosphate ABC transporter ATP-binding protein UgpC [Duganella alba]
MASVSLKALRKSYDGRSDILAGIDLDIAHGEFVVLVGPSGCGKSTLLRMLCGLESITGGTMQIGGKTVNHLPPAERGIAMVFQSYALYPHMTVYQNMAFGLKVAGKDKAAIKARITQAAGTLKIDHLLERLPRELSGGQRQRVAIGRAIVREPQLFLFDEPLSNLDAALRVQTRLEIAKLHRQLDATIVYVTHDQVEAMTLGDKIVVMHEGHIQQAGTPLDLYQQPRNLFVAGFIGSPKMNLMAASVTEAHAGGVTARLDSGELIHAAVDGSGLAAGARVTLGLRAEHINESRGGSEVLSGHVSVVEHLGEANYIYVTREGGEDVVIRGDGERHVEIGQHLVFSAESTAFHLFDEQGEARRRLRPGNMVAATRGVMRSA